MASAPRKMAEWFLGELPGLEESGVVDGEAAAALRGHYEPVLLAPRRSVAMVAFGILGGVLVGLGIVLLLAHNWQWLSRPVRTVVAFLPLLAGVGLAGFTVACRWESDAWREGSGAFLMAAVGTSIALVSQTYHAMADLTGFLLIWMLLSAPLAYVLRSGVVAAFYWIGLLAWAGEDWGRALAFWPLVAAMLPYFWMAWRERPDGVRVSWMGWVLAVCLSIAPMVVRTSSGANFAFLLSGVLFALFHLAAYARSDDAPGFWRHPFGAVGALGMVILMLILSFGELHGGREWWRYEGRLGQEWMVHDAILLAVLLGGVAFCAVAVVRQRRPMPLVFGAGALLVGVLYVARDKNLARGLCSLYLLALGLLMLREGVKTDSLRRLNAGMGILALLVAARFFDQDVSLAWRGLAFIVLGLGFLGTNVWMLKRRKEVAR